MPLALIAGVLCRFDFRLLCIATRQRLQELLMTRVAVAAQRMFARSMTYVSEPWVCQRIAFGMALTNMR